MRKYSKDQATVLVVEDRVIDREMLVDLLEHSKYRVLEAGDGPQALELARSHHPDLIISDVLLPDMDGYQLVQELRADPALADTSVIFHTALFNEREAQDLAKEIGVVCIIPKPTEPEKLLKNVAGILKEQLPQAASPAPCEFEQKHLQLLIDKLINQVKDLQRSEELFRHLVDGVRDYAIFMLDAEGRVTSWNEGAQRIKGWTEEEIVGQDFSLFYTLEDVAAGHPQRELEIAARQGRYEEEGWRVREDGSQFWANVIITALYDDQRLLRGFTKVTSDVSERKRRDDERQRLLAEQQALNEELSVANEELITQSEELTFQKEELERLNQNLQIQRNLLESANEELEAFTYSVSHELKTPVRTIQGYSRMLKSEHSDKLDAEGLRLLKVITDSTQVMNNLIEDLLAVSRLERMEIRYSVVNLTAMAGQIFDQLKTEALGRDVRLKLEDLPPASGDQSLLYHVLMNLLSNAFKYTKPKKHAVIEVGGYTEGKENIYFVKDNGIGFDKRYASNLFHPFQRLHTDQGYEGSGIGLSIVKRLILRHGGRVWAQGVIDKGATFYFSLPSGES